MALDGELIFDTKIDDTGLKKDIEDIGKKAEEAASGSKKALDTVEKKAEKVTSEIKKDLNGVGNATENITSEVKKDIESISDTTEKAAKGLSIGSLITGSLAADAIKAAGGALLDAAKAGMAFESSMSNVAAVSGAAGTELDGLTDLAREYGATTVFSASECADALNYMAMAGWNTEQMTNGLSGILNLAAASGEDLATTSDIVTDALTAFGLSADDSGHFADILATASSNANTNVSMMGETFKYVAPVAGALGYAAEDVAVAIGLMANSGIKASQAGTALRALLSNMAEPSREQANAMNELGLSLTDSSGKMKSFGDLMLDVRGAFNGLDESSKASYASIIAGSEGMSGLLAVVNASESDFTGLTNSIANCDGACDSMAKTMTDNVEGGLKELSSAAEDAQIELYDAVKPMIKDALPGIKGFFTWIKENAGSIGNLLKPIGGALQVIFAVLKPIMTILSPIIGVVGKLTGFIGDLMSVFAKATMGVEDYNGTMSECKAEIESTASALRKAQDEYGANSDAARSLQAELDMLNAQYEKGGGDAQVYADKLDELTSSFEELKIAQSEAMSEIGNSETKGMRAVAMLQSLSERSNLTSHDLDVMGKYADYLNDTFDCNIKVNYDTGELTGFDPKKVMQDVADKINQNKQTIAVDYLTNDEFTSNYMTLVKTYSDIVNEKENLQKVIDRMQDSYGTLEWDTSLAAINTDNIGKLVDLKTKIQEYEDSLSEAEKTIREYGKQAGWSSEMTQVYIDSMKDAVDKGSEFVSITEDSSSALTEQEQGINAAEDVIRNYEEEIENIAKAYDDAYSAALKSFEGQFGLFDKAKADSEATVSSAQEALNSQLTYWKSYSDNLNILKGKSAESLGITQENFNLLLTSLSDGSEKSAGLLANLVSGGDTAIANMANTLGELDKTREEAAGTAAAINSNLDEEMEKVKENMKEDVDALDLSDDAKKSATATINAYTEGIKLEMKNAASAAQSVVDAVKNVFSNANLSFSAGGVSGSVNVKVPGHARGTTNAENAFIAGENGPELILGMGGSTVFPASETARIVDAVSSMIPNTSSLYNSLLSYTPSMADFSGGSSASPASSGGGSTVVKPSFNIYIGDNEIKDFVIDTITSENAATGGMSV